MSPTISEKIFSNHLLDNYYITGSQFTHLTTWLIFQIFGALAEFERNLIRERTLAGLRAARARGRIGGRPKALDTTETELLYKLRGEKEHTVKEICQILGISKPTFYTYFK